MVSLPMLVRYAANKLEYSLTLSWKRFNVGQINAKQLNDSVWKNFFNGTLTFLYSTKGEEMAPVIAGQKGTLLVRSLPFPESTQVFVGDVVLLKDPEKHSNYIVRRLAAMEGHEMVSKDEQDTPFILEKDQCWVISDNEAMKPKEARDSRLFGPVPITSIEGRVIYSMRSAVDHGPVENSHYAMAQDTSLLAFELDVDEMSKRTKT